MGSAISGLPEFLLEDDIYFKDIRLSPKYFRENRANTLLFHDPFKIISIAGAYRANCSISAVALTWLNCLGQALRPWWGKCENCCLSVAEDRWGQSQWSLQRSRPRL